AERYAGTRIIFSDTGTSNWAWDEVAQAYYWHRFFSHQPDLNFDSPHVLRAMLRVMDLWLRLGVDGFRPDAVPYLVERAGTSNESLRETHEIVRVIRRAIVARHPDRMLLAEANQWPEDVRDYFGDGGDECQMAYHFPLMPRMYMAIAQEDRHPIVEIMEQTPAIPDTCQWAIFLRNHDELTLETVTSRQRDYMYQAYAADPRARPSSSTWTTRLLRVRSASHAFGSGTLRLPRAGSRRWVVSRRAYWPDTTLCVASLSCSAQPVERDLSEHRGGVPVELLGRT